MRHCHCQPGLKATLHRADELQCLLAEVSSSSKSILNPWRDVLGSAPEDQSFHCMKIPPCDRFHFVSVFRVSLLRKTSHFQFIVLLRPHSVHNQAKVKSPFISFFCFCFSGTPEQFFWIDLPSPTSSLCLHHPVKGFERAFQPSPFLLTCSVLSCLPSCFVSVTSLIFSCSVNLFVLFFF